MNKAKNEPKFINLVITEGKPSIRSRIKKNYRICTVTNNHRVNYINLKIPMNVQQKIIDAYSQGKQVRIYA